MGEAVPKSWRWWWIGWWCWFADGDGVSAVVGKPQPVGGVVAGVGVSGQQELATVVRVVVMGAQTREVGGVGESPVASNSAFLASLSAASINPP